MRLNKASAVNVFTHEGAKAIRIDPTSELRRAVLSCLLWEDGFYESGQSISDRITDLVSKVKPEKVAAIAVEARERMHLRHVPLLLTSELAKHASGSSIVSDTIQRVVKRADEPAELLKIYWRNGKTPIANQIKKGLAKVLPKFSGYQLGKYNRDDDVKIKDVAFLSHPKPAATGEAELIGRITSKSYSRGEVMRHAESPLGKLINGTLETPDTWEVNLSGGADKKETFERLVKEGKLGYLALLRNLRNMDEAGCNFELVNNAILARKGAENVLPFRYVAAARAAPVFVRSLDTALQACIKEMPELPGRTIVLVDVSGSMNYKLSTKSDLTRMDAAATLASIIPGDVRVFSFSDRTVEVPAYRGLAGVDAIVKSQRHNGTQLFEAVEQANRLPHDRLIVITDEQASGRRINPVVDNAYMINVASYRNGVGYGAWKHIDGFSESVLTWIREVEK